MNIPEINTYSLLSTYTHILIFAKFILQKYSYAEIPFYPFDSSTSIFHYISIILVYFKIYKKNKIEQLSCIGIESAIKLMQ